MDLQTTLFVIFWTAFACKYIAAATFWKYFTARKVGPMQIINLIAVVVAIVGWSIFIPRAVQATMNSETAPFASFYWGLLIGIYAAGAFCIKLFLDLRRGQTTLQESS